MGLHSLQGLAYEMAYMREVEHFKDAGKGVSAADVAAALILRDHNQTELLRRLHQREITCCVDVDEDSELEDLVFKHLEVWGGSQPPAPFAPVGLILERDS